MATEVLQDPFLRVSFADESGVPYREDEEQQWNILIYALLSMGGQHLDTMGHRTPREALEELLAGVRQKGIELPWVGDLLGSSSVLKEMWRLARPMKRDRIVAFDLHLKVRETLPSNFSVEAYLCGVDPEFRRGYDSRPFSKVCIATFTASGGLEASLGSLCDQLRDWADTGWGGAFRRFWYRTQHGVPRDEP